MKKLVLCAVAAVVATLGATAEPLEVAVALNGDVRVGETGAKLKAQIHLEKWKGVAAGAFTVSNVADVATGTTMYPLYCERSTTQRAGGRTTLRSAADGRAAAEFLVTSTAGQKTEGVFLELEMPDERFAGAKWTTSAGANGVLPEKKNGIAYVWKGDRKSTRLNSSH